MLGTTRRQMALRRAASPKSLLYHMLFVSRKERKCSRAKAKGLAAS